MRVNAVLALPLALSLLCVTASCAPQGRGTFVTISSSTGAIVASATFYSAVGSDEVVFEANAQVLPPGTHGFHIHEGGACDRPDFASAGLHFNPTNQMHGSLDQPNHHAGDLGNLEINAGGSGSFRIITTSLSVYQDSLLNIANRVLVVDQDPDDFVSQPLGSAGRYIACGVIPPATEY